MLEHEAKIRGYNLGSLMQQKWLDVIMARYSISSIDDLYASVGYGGFTVNQILSKLIDFYKKEEKSHAPVKQNFSVKSSSTSGIIVKGHDDLLVRISRCCNPVPGDDIVGFISRGRGIAIHRVGCSNLKNVEPFRLIEAHWEGEKASSFIVAVQVEGKDSNGLLARITTTISDMNLTMTSLVARMDKNNNVIVNFSIRVNKIDEFERLQKRISQIPSVDKVFRSNGQ